MDATLPVQPALAPTPALPAFAAARDHPDEGTAAGASTDVDLIERLRAGRADALGALYDAYGRMAYGLAYRITRDPALAEDAVQDAFLGAWNNARNYSPERASVKTWLLSIVHHRSVDIVRRRRRPVESLTPESSSPELVREDLWSEVKQRLDRTTVVSALASLPNSQREVIELAYFGGLTQVEIAERTGAPLGTVKSRVRAGLETLRRTLEHQGLGTSPS